MVSLYKDPEGMSVLSETSGHVSTTGMGTGTRRLNMPWNSRDEPNVADMQRRIDELEGILRTQKVANL